MGNDLAELSGGPHLVVEEPHLADRLLAAGMDRRRVWLGVDPATQNYVHLRRLTDCAAELKLPLLAVGKALFGEAEDYDVARLLAAIRLGTTYDAVGRVRRGGNCRQEACATSSGANSEMPVAAIDPLPHPRAFMRDAGALAQQLAGFPQAVENNRRLARRCAQFRLLPRKPVFPDFVCPDGLTASAYLRRLCEQGARCRYGGAPPEGFDERLAKELTLIERMGFCEYFLVVWDIVQYARRHNAPVAGRGSGASSLVAYLLGVTNVCPLGYGIPFERFLNERREDFPDLDVDFCWRIRDEVIDYAFRRWGAEHVAMVCTHNTFQERSALREVAKALGLSNDQVSRLEGLDFDDEAECPRAASRGLGERNGVDAQEGKDAVGRKVAREGKVAIEGKTSPSNILSRIATFASRITGLPHNLSVHPGGIVIGRKTIDHYVPIQQAAKGVRIAQFDKDGVEDIALVKLDLLGNRNLSTLRYACDLIRRRRGQAVDIETLPPDDGPTIALLQQADTVGCNQLESPAMRHLLKSLQVRHARDVMQALALIRPGAAGIGMKEAFIRRHRGLESATGATATGCAAIESILGKTYGIMLCEDDVMLVAAALMGTSLAEGDRFRKAVQKCPDDRRRMKLSMEFLARCKANGVEAELAKSLWVQMAKFNAYSFCRAHAASYGLLAYAGAYLKRHYPLEFWVAALNNNQSMYHPRVYVEQAKRAGIRFLLPDINRSLEEFSAEKIGTVPYFSGEVKEIGNCPYFNGAIRVGFNRVAGLGPSGIADILQARNRRPFEGLSDCLLRTHLGQPEARSLVLCGALDSFGRSRPTLIMELNLFLKIRPGRFAAGQDTLLPAVPIIPNVPVDYEDQRKYLDERRILGISVGPHIMAFYRQHRKAVAARTNADSRHLAQNVGRTVRIAGVLEAQRTARTQQGGEMIFLTVGDEFGLFEVTVFPDAGGRIGPLSQYGPYIVTGKVQEQYDTITIAADRAELVSD